MALSVEEMEALLRMAIRATACLPDLPAAARIEAEAAIDAEARRAIAGLPNRVGDPAFLDAFGWTEEPAAEDVAEQLRFSIGGHFEAYDDAIPGRVCQSAPKRDPLLECAPRIGQMGRFAIDRGRAF